jgi:hypothetical protein
LAIEVVKLLVKLLMKLYQTGPNIRQVNRPVDERWTVSWTLSLEHVNDNEPRLDNEKAKELKPNAIQ